LFLVREVAILRCRSGWRLHCRARESATAAEKVGVIHTDFATENPHCVCPVAVTARPRAPKVPESLATVFFELDLKINIPLFTNYEINVLVCSSIYRRHRLDDRHGSHPSARPLPDNPTVRTEARIKIGATHVISA
ncbi:hypothetical protein, partial [Serratia marcescens]|uniref:hypothetical protein n=1 Tax=Serratia marcescens TaxID=615 RepID=UPI002AA0D3AA